MNYDTNINISNKELQRTAKKMSISPAILLEEAKNQFLEKESIQDILESMKKGNTAFEKLAYVKSSDINRIIESVRGLKHESTSRTETWIVNFNEEIRKELKVSSGFMKISVDSNSYCMFENKETYSYLGTYKTENTIYSYINLLVETKICNNFVRMLSVKNDVEMKDMVSIISEKMVNGKHLNARNAKNNFKRNIVDSINDSSDRNEIGFVKRGPVKFNVRRNWTYQYVMTEALTCNDSIMSDYMGSLFSHRVPFTINTWNIIFQVSHACFVMEKFLISHNDLHPGNIWLRLQEKQEEYTYIVGEKIFTFTPKYIALIYDYDRGYAECNGVKINNTVTYEEFAQTNEVIRGRDFTRFIYIVYRYHVHDKNNKNIILDCICKKSDECRMNVIEYFDEQEMDYNMLKEDFLKENILPIEEIMVNFSVICKTTNVITQNKENIYRCKETYTFKKKE
jgi:hypothetical protein